MGVIESAFRQARQSALDYLEVASYSQFKATVVRLKTDPLLRNAMTQHGRGSATAVIPDCITHCWIEFLNGVALPAYQRWRRQLRLGWLAGQALADKAQRKVYRLTDRLIGS
ncbi:MAG: hypothetical protein AAF728_16610 [Cyanobacteria bacterium P01_D01_bin.128]